MSDDPSKHSDTSIASVRFDADKRQLGGLLMIAGICAIFEPLSSIAENIGPDGTTASSGTSFSMLFGGLCLVKIGILSVFLGYNQAVHDWGNKHLTAYLMTFSLTALIPYITKAVEVGRNASDQEYLIPIYYVPSQSDYNFVGAMGILGILSYSAAFVGAILSISFTLFVFQGRNPQDHSVIYYKSHLVMYCTALLVAGLSQLMLGAYIIENFGSGRMEYGPIIVAMYAVSFPEISVVVGLVQVLNAIWGIARATGFGVFGKDDFSFQHSIYLGWFLQFVLQIVVQISYLPGGAGSDALATATAVSFGLNLMPAYLDYKTRMVTNPDVTQHSEDTRTSINIEIIENIVIVEPPEEIVNV